MGRKDEVCINGMFVYTIKHKPLEAGHPKTDAYVADQRMPDARFRLKCSQGELVRILLPRKHSCRV